MNFGKGELKMERRIYEGWAYSENSTKKGSINYQIYKEDLEPKARQIRDHEPTEEDLQKYTCYKLVDMGFGQNKYKILSNPHNFSDLELALICDQGNLCFGYKREGSYIVIHTN